MGNVFSTRVSEQLSGVSTSGITPAGGSACSGHEIMQAGSHTGQPADPGAATPMPVLHQMATVFKAFVAFIQLILWDIPTQWIKDVTAVYPRLRQTFSAIQNGHAAAFVNLITMKNMLPNRLPAQPSEPSVSDIPNPSGHSEDAGQGRGFQTGQAANSSMPASMPVLHQMATVFKMFVAFIQDIFWDTPIRWIKNLTTTDPLLQEIFSEIQNNNAEATVTLIKTQQDDATYKNVLSRLDAVTNIGCPDIVIALLDAGINIQTAGKSVHNVLIWAAKHGHTQVVEALIARGAKLNSKNELGYTALQAAALTGHVETANVLLACGAAIDSKDKHGDTALMIAALKGHAQIVDVLLQYNAAINSKNKWGETALMKAAFKGHFQIFNVLLQYGGGAAAIDIKSKRGDTALMMAAFGGRTQIVEALTTCGAKMNSTNKYGNTALILATLEGHIEIVDHLLQKGAEINRKNKRGDTALICAVSEGYVGVVKTLLAHDASIYVENNNGETALTQAQKKGYSKIAELLQQQVEK